MYQCRIFSRSLNGGIIDKIEWREVWAMYKDHVYFCHLILEIWILYLLKISVFENQIQKSQHKLCHDTDFMCKLEYSNF